MVMHLLSALVAGLGGILEIASVLNGYGLASNRLSTSALLVNGLGDTHDDGFAVVVEKFTKEGRKLFCLFF